ncbi:helix-turn-helix domain-containing protein [Ideonella sp. DXS29W]|uniref:Helix-turn-helix domain-containing protein n=1 Tax=Ideonella lacteola TaxID=2984193 RepID=A0ABU9BKV7_9BURK
MVLETDIVAGRVERRRPSRAPLVGEFIRGAYHPKRTLPELLRGLMGSLAGQVAARRGQLRLSGLGTLAFESAAGAFNAGWIDGTNGHARNGRHHPSVATAASPAKPSNGSHGPGPSAPPTAFPLVYGNVALGELQLEWPAAQPGAVAWQTMCEEFAAHCARLAMRFETQRWAGQRLGRPLLLVGASEALLRIESFVEMAAFSTLPVLLTGEFGTEKALLAAAIHCCGPCAAAPFVEVPCASAGGQPAQWFEQAHGGTLFFNGIDELPPPLQQELLQHMHSRLGQRLSTPAAPELRVIASSTADLYSLAQQGGFSRALQAELDFLRARVPPLRERPEDIEALVTAAIERQGFDAGRLLTDDLLAQCRAHAWPENLFELERVIARLAVMSRGQPIRYADLLHHAPHLAADRRIAPRPSPSAPLPPPAPRPAEPPLAHWVRCAMTRNLPELARLHDGLRKALVYLGEHHADAISLDGLARQAHVSPSHLSFLFRTTLKTTFKSLLQHIRIERARQLMAEDPRRRITDIALTVGFVDLSHFEKCFRRIIGSSPRDYRHRGEPS